MLRMTACLQCQFVAASQFRYTRGLILVCVSSGSLMVSNVMHQSLETVELSCSRLIFYLIVTAQRSSACSDMTTLQMLTLFLSPFDSLDRLMFSVYIWVISAHMVSAFCGLWTPEMDSLILHLIETISPARVCVYVWILQTLSSNTPNLLVASIILNSRITLLVLDNMNRVPLVNCLLFSPLVLFIERNVQNIVNNLPMERGYVGMIINEGQYSMTLTLRAAVQKFRSRGFISLHKRKGLVGWSVEAAASVQALLAVIRGEI
jgi:hypothetical protein